MFCTSCIRMLSQLTRKGAHSQFFLAHHRVNMKKKANTSDAILLADSLNPHAIKAAPIKDEPRYPAGKVSQGIPPDILVTPPSSAKEGE